MKLDRKRKTFVAISGFVGTAALAVPLGIGLVPRDGSLVGLASNQTEFTSATAVQLPFGEQPPNLAPPVLDIKGLDRTNYGLGAYSTSTYDKTKSVQDNAGATITFVYNSLAQPPGRSIYVTHPLAALRGRGNTPNSFTPPREEVEIGATVFPAVTNLADLLKQGNYPYTADPSVPPVYQDGVGNPLSSADLPKLPVGAIFTARYTARLDTANYEGDPVGIFVFSYIIGGKQLPAVANLPANGPEQRRITYGTDLQDFPVPPAGTQKDHYTLKNGLPQATVTSRPQGAYSTPPVGETVFLDSVQNYDAGTVFTVTYTYTPESQSYKGADYTYTYVYTIDTLTAVPPLAANGSFPDVSTQFGKFTETQQPAPPAYQGYNGFVLSTVVTTASSAPSVSGNMSPTPNDLFRWDSVNIYSAGTRFRVTFQYTPARNYSGATFTITRDYEITKQPFAVPKDMTTADDNTSYVAGTAFYDSVTPPATPSMMKLVGTTASLYRDKAAKTPMGIDEVRSLKVGDSFTARWTYELLDPYNYEPQKGDKATYSITTTFKVAARAP